MHLLFNMHYLFLKASIKNFVYVEIIFMILWVKHHLFIFIIFSISNDTITTTNFELNSDS